MNLTFIILIVAGPLACVVVGICLLRRRQTRIRRENADNSLTGSTEMLGSYELRQRSFEGDHALVLGYHIDPDRPAEKTEDAVADFQFEASLILGPPGSGKTAYQLAPNILRHSGSTFASTTKADIIQATLQAAMARKSLAGHDDVEYGIAIFDPADLIDRGQENDPVLAQAANHCRTWTPIAEALTWDRSSAVASAMLTAVDSHDNQSDSGSSGFFARHSTNIVAALLLLARLKPGTTLYDVLDRVEMLSGILDDDDTTRDDRGANVPASGGKTDAWDHLQRDLALGEEVLDKKIKSLEERDLQGSPKHKELQGQKQGARLARMALKPSLGAVRAAETKAGIIGAISQLTSDWLMSPRVMEQRWDAEDALNIGNLPGLHTVYMTCPTVEHRPLANAFLGAYMSELQRRAQRSGGRLPDRHLVVLDELAYCTPHSDMLSWANNVARSAGIKLVLGTQAMSDLEIVWGEAKSRSLFNACKGAKVLMPGCTDSKALKEFSELAGKRNLIQVSSVATSTSDSSGFSGLKVIAEDGRVQRSTSETVTQSVVEKDTASPARLAAMPADTALAWLPGEPGIPGGTIQVRTIPYFSDPLLHAAADGDVKAVQQVGVPPQRSTRSVNLDNPLSKYLRKQSPPAQ